MAKTTPEPELTQNRILRMSDAKTYQLIELYKREECLWNTNCREYSMRWVREAAAQRIAKELDIKHFGSRHVIIKFKNLRNSYSQELKKIESSLHAGDDPVYRPKVFWFDKIDSFLLPHVQSRRKIVQLNHEITVKTESEDEVYEIISNSEEEVENSNDYEPETKRSRATSYDSNLNISNQLLESTLPVLQNTIPQLTNVGHSRDDCFDSFGKYVADMLKSMPRFKAMRLQPKIVTLLVSESLNDEDMISQSDDKQFL